MAQTTSMTRRRPTASFAFAVPLMPMVRLRLRAEQGGRRAHRIFFQLSACGQLVENRETWPARHSRRFAAKFCHWLQCLIVIREFETGDFEILWRMDQECFPPGIAYSKQELRAYIRH